MIKKSCYIFLYVISIHTLTSQPIQKPSFELEDSLSAYYLTVATALEATAEYEEALNNHKKRQSEISRAFLSLKTIDRDKALADVTLAEKKYYTLKEKFNINQQSSLLLTTTSKDEVKPKKTVCQFPPEKFVSKKEIQLPKTLIVKPGILCLKSKKF